MLSDQEALKSLSDRFYDQMQTSRSTADTPSVLNAIQRELFCRHHNSFLGSNRTTVESRTMSFEDMQQEEKTILATLRRSLDETIQVDVEEVLGVKAKPLFHCVKCKSQNVSYVLRQTRSADEGMTCIFTCQDCKHSYVDA